MAHVDSELDELRRKVYGPPIAGTATQADVERLQRLESDRAARGADDVLEWVDVAPDADEGVLGTGAGEAHRDPRSAPHKRFGHLSWLGWTVAAGAGLLLVALGVGIGASVFTPRQPTMMPEFALAQTDEDLIPADMFFERPALDPSSTRFIARIDGYDVFLAKGAEGQLVCFVTYQADAELSTPISVGCSAGDLGGLVIGVTPELSVGYRAVAPEGTVETVRLSENVSAYRH